MTPQERKVMELALEALEGLKSLYGGNGHKLHEINAIHRNHDTAITVLEEALMSLQDGAQPEQEPVAWCHPEDDKTYFTAYPSKDMIENGYWQPLYEKGSL